MRRSCFLEKALVRRVNRRSCVGTTYDARVTCTDRSSSCLAAARWVAHGDAVLLLGPPGVGKSHLAIALGRETIRQGYSVRFATAQAVMASLVKAHSEGILEDRLAFYAKPSF